MRSRPGGLSDLRHEHLSARRRESLSRDPSQNQPGSAQHLLARPVLGLANKELDVAFANPQELRKESFHYCVFVDEAHVLAVPREHRLANLKQVPLSELDGEPLVTYHRHTSCKTMQLFLRIL